MIVGGLFSVFALGLRHGADPDHLAAIDNVTRNSYTRHPRLSRWVGTLFASGHTIMVLAISAIVGLIGERFTAHGELIERIGGWISVFVLMLIAVANIRALRSGSSAPAGIRFALVPRRLREGSSVFLAVPIGLLFGFGFETSSQIATYAVAFGAERGVGGAVLVGALFCFGMIVTDTLDSVVVHRLLGFRSADLPGIMRTWIVSVTALAIFVALYETLQLLGWQPPLSDLQVSAGLCTALLFVFAFVLARTRNSAHLRNAPSPAPTVAPTGDLP